MRCKRIFLVAGLILSSNGFSEDLLRGRLPDGRAFRTDATGNQIIDYIAELEVTIEALNRQVYGLQAELEEKEAGAGATAQLTETNTLGGLGAPPAISSKPAELLQQTDSKSIACEAENDALEKEISWYKTVLQSYKKDSPALGSAHTEQVEKLSEQLANKTEELEELKAKYQQLEQDTENKARAMLRDEPSTRARLSLGDKTRAPQQVNNGAAVATLQSSARTELNQLHALIRSRDLLFKEYGKNSQALTIAPSRAVSNRYLTPVQISQLINNASYPSEISALKRDISQIEKKIRDDIALVKRLDRAAKSP
jgi:regulator of replication initiation timing